MPRTKLQVGGQAVIEGVMMRSPQAVAVAVRRPDGSILVRRQVYTSLIRRLSPLAWPVLRGATVLVESLAIGMQALAFSADAALDANRNGATAESETRPGSSQRTAGEGWLPKLWLGATVVLSLAVGLALFFYVPLVLADLTGATSGFVFNLVDGFFRLAIFLGYLVLITLLPDIRRIFEYHGAEHKSIFTFESGRPLTAEEATRFSRLHPRCGTSFLLIVMIVSIFVFMFLGRPDGIGERLVRLALVPLIGGLSYELIRLSDRNCHSLLWRPFIAPGLWLQKLTTREPAKDQLEVALVALKSALGEDLRGQANVVVVEGPSSGSRTRKEMAVADVS